MAGSMQKVSPPELKAEGLKVQDLSTEQKDIIGQLTKISNKLKESWDSPAQRTFESNFIQMRKTLDQFTETIAAYGAEMVSYANDAQEVDERHSAKFN
jgi:WXG100 family type VII secretion target